MLFGGDRIEAHFQSILSVPCFDFTCRLDPAIGFADPV